MNNTISTRTIIYTGLFAALGILLPQAFHMIGGQGAGSIFLPIHLPVFIGAMLLGPLSGVFIALISILVGIMLGMPPMPLAVFILIELIVYAVVTGYLYHNKRWHIYIVLPIAMILGRLVKFGAVILALQILSIKLPPVFGTFAMFLPGIPGMIIQIVLIPTLIITLERTVGRDGAFTVK